MKSENQIHSIEERMNRKSRRKWYYTVSVTAAAIVVFCTVYALILPAITLEKKQAVLDCPLNVHQHTAECCDENGTLICGQADFVVHTHNESCYDAENELVCKLPEIAAHQHTDDCYEAQRVLVCTNEAEEHTHDDACYKTEKTLTCKETAVLHTHDDTCRDENGTLICGMLQVTEHVHDAACSQPAEQPVEQAAVSGLQPDVMLAAAASAAWGYNEDGSIWWWSDASLTSVALNNIQENTPYIIAGNSRLNVLTGTPQGDNMMATVRPGIGNAGSYKSYEIWYFKKDEGSENKYRIYAGEGQYLKLDGTALSLTDENDATVFTVQQATAAGYTHCVTIESGGYYLNTFGGDSNGCSGWAGWNQADAGSCQQILKLTGEQQTASRIETASSPNTVINLFDYWVSDNRNDPDNVTANLNAGINQGHALKFVHGDQPDTDGMPVNRWTGSGQNPRQGIVQNKLGSDGYPVLSDMCSVDGYDDNEPLQYLFNPDKEHPGKVSYRNVGGLLYIDSQGYYAFDSRAHMAEFNEKSNSFNVYDTPSVAGQFFPFNKAPEIMTITRENEKINHYFGATLTTRFVQQHSGHADERHTTPTTFEFSGDDDVWIFIDGVLVGDVGGIHDRASVSINFATGEVEVGVIGGSNPLKTTLKDCYVNAGKYNSDEWIEENGNTTYKDGTVHTLKFFYLERGNYDSNMQLKYNLTEIPRTAIYKVDQYGETVPGATFAVYAADADYHMLDSMNGSPVSPSDSSTYDDKGNLVDSGGNIIANALYTGTTNQKGEMLFADSDGMPYSINELQDMFGVHFILREIKVPDGYRVVTKDVHLQIWQGASQRILRCMNTEQSGSRAASTLQITATDILHLQTPYDNQDTVEYCDPNTGQSNGTLFAVVFRYIGAIDENGNATEINDSQKWVPVYGSDQDGYNMVDMTGKTQLAGALEAAVEAQKYGDVVFKISPSSTMQLTLKNLPGHITTYYYMLGDKQKGQTRYTVAYYWTAEDSLEAATETNIHRVYTFAEAVPDGSSYSGFERVFGADIQVPNLINRVFVQKVDEKNNLINGATFAIYQVKQSEDGTIQYLSEGGGYNALSENAVVASDGEITDGTIHVSPLKTDITKTYEDAIHTGSAEFTNLSDGQYIIKEVKPPPGYKVNTADVMVLVTEDTIYTNAGTEDDGVTVGRGPGYLVSPLNQFASEGQIDNTLTWVYAQMRISKESTSFADVGDESTIQGYLKENYTNVTTNDVSEAFKTYLKYAKENAGAAFDYVPDPDRNEDEDSDGYRRLFTTVGWPYYEVYQDYEYGSEKARASGANYEDWSKDELTNLFSRSTYIRIMDEQATTLKVKKADAASPATGLAGAKFRLYTTAEDGTALYYSWNSETKTVEWTEDETQAFVITTGEDGMADEIFTGLKDGAYYLEEIKVPNGYCKPKEPVKLMIKEAKLTLDPEKPPGEQIAEIGEGELDEDNLYTYTVTVYNSTGFELPATGGSGTILYTTGGILLMALPLVYGYRKHRDERRAK